ncbi:hypothetical protein IV73_GL000592 [Weissella kandleri]|uniref:Uncharacterized protein n=1 Tax=Weissella kandleri TaxID=1616 RepID=A0A0R2JDK0_9LACO|nr:hypothetical protein [Weissella kandleri]KRN75426.1 hypothetical protein IV73_GL000592 [Weissella kandleri]
MKFKHLRYVIAIGLMTIFSGVVWPLMQRQRQWQIPESWLQYGYPVLAGISFVILLLLIVQMYRQWRQAESGTETEVGWATLGIFSWLVLWLVTMFYAKNNAWVLLPIMLLGVTLLLIVIDIFQIQPLDQLKPLDQRNLVGMSFVTWIIALYGLIFFSLTINFMTGLTVLITVILITDVRWSTMISQYQRLKVKNHLTNLGVKVNRWGVFDQLPGIKNMVIEKSGILTENSAQIYSVKSLDDRYSDNDVIGIAAGLLDNFASPLSSAFATYAKTRGISASEVSEPEKVNLIGISGVIHQERFSVISAREALKNYAVNPEVLANYQAIGNSVSYIVDGIQVIGVINYGTPLKFSLLDIDRELTKRKIKTQVISADASGAVRDLPEIFHSANVVKAGLSPSAKIAMQLTYLSRNDALLITNQQIPSGVPDRIMIEVGDSLPFVDIQMNDLSQLKFVLQASDDFVKISHRNLRWLNMITIILLLFGLILGLILGNLIILAPLFALGIRIIISTILVYQTRN